jgi:hypothetical protein
MVFIELAQYASMLLSALIMVMGFIGAGLYHKAYYEMKKSPIILSVSLLLYAVALKFFFVSINYFAYFKDQQFMNGFLMAISLIPNVIMLLAVCNFVHQSVKTPDTKNKIEQAKQIKLSEVKK